MDTQFSPADIRNKVNSMEKELINYAGTDKYDEKREELEQIKREANEEFGPMYNI
jgi:hypothetical protein